MKRLLFLSAVIVFCLNIANAAWHNRVGQKPRVIVSTDIGGTDADDNQSMAHLLMYSDLVDIEGIISSPSYGNGSKDEILRMIDLYAQDYPVLKMHCDSLMTPERLRAVTKQGRKGVAPLCGYSTPTEGSEWIVECARRESNRPLWVLVWGATDDLAQALHDAPDIASKIRVHYIGGPNKKWGANSYTYIAKHYPDLWMIEDNASYRGFIADTDDESEYQAGYYNAHIKGAGAIGDDFVNYYDGVCKMGDTPSLLYLLGGTPDSPDSGSWGGQYEPLGFSPRRTVALRTAATDTVPVYSIVELKYEGKDAGYRKGEECFTLTIDDQQWRGTYTDDGEYMVRYAPKKPGTLPYEVTFDTGKIPTVMGTLVVSEDWPGERQATDMALGGNWYTDSRDVDMYEGIWQGAKTVSKYREKALDDWASRLSWLKVDRIEQKRRHWMIALTAGYNSDSPVGDLSLTYWINDYIGAKFGVGIAEQVTEIYYKPDPFNLIRLPHATRVKFMPSVELKSPALLQWRKDYAHLHIFANPGLCLSPGAKQSVDARWFNWQIRTGLEIDVRAMVLQLGYEYSDFNLRSGLPLDNRPKRTYEYPVGTNTVFATIGFKF